MCMVMAAAGGDIALCATDTRTNASTIDGDVHRFDPGGKLLLSGRAWIASTGDHVTMATGFAALRGVDVSDVQAVSERLAGAHARYAAGIRAVLQSSRLERHRFFLARHAEHGPEVVLLDAAGRVCGTGGFSMSFPPEIGPADVRRAHIEISGWISKARRLGDLMRVVALAFDSTSQRAETMSGTVEIGITVPDGRGGLRHLHACRKAAELWPMTAAAAEATLRPASQGVTYRPGSAPVLDLQERVVAACAAAGGF
jgi:hypothetical protein